MKKNRESNTKKYAENIFVNGFVNFDYYEMVALSKYAHNELGWTKDKIEKEIIERCSTKENFNLVLHYDIINQAISKRKFLLLDDVNSVSITQKEVDILKGLSEKYAKVLFVILVKSKQDNPNYDKKLYYNYSLGDAIKISKIVMKPNERNEFNYFCGKNNFLLATRRSINSWEVMFHDIEHGEEIICVNDFDKIIDFFPRWCCECGKVFKKTGRAQKMCKECAIEKEKERKKKRNWSTDKMRDI